MDLIPYRIISSLEELPDEMLSLLLQTSRNRQFREVSSRFRRLYDDPRTMLPSDVRRWASQPIEEADGGGSDHGDGYGTAATATYLPELLRLVRYLNAVQDSVEIYEIIRNWVLREGVEFKTTIVFLRSGVYEQLRDMNFDYSWADMERDFSFSRERPQTLFEF